MPTTLPSGEVYYAPGSPFVNPALANTTTWMSEGVSSYNGLQVDVNRRFYEGFQIRGVYTWAKSLDDGTAWNSSVAANAPGFVMYPAKPQLDWGPSTTDVRHLAVINGTWELPVWARQSLLLQGRSHFAVFCFRLDDERHCQPAEWLSLHSATWIQPNKQWGYKKSHPSFG